MEINLYKLPLDFRSFFESRNFKTCTGIKESLNQYIQLILTTQFGASRFDPKFGCELWDVDFQLIFSINQWKERMQAAIHHIISNYEQRLQDVRIKVEVMEEHIELKEIKANKVRRKMIISIQAKLAETGFPYEYTQPIYMNPISID